MLHTFIVIQVFTSRVYDDLTKAQNTDSFLELSYELLKGDFDYTYYSGDRAYLVKLKAYWIKVTERTYVKAKLTKETAALEGPVSADLRKAKEFCRYISYHHVFPEHLVSVLEDTVISRGGGMEYSEDFDRAAEMVLDTADISPEFIRHRSQM